MGHDFPLISHSQLARKWHKQGGAGWEESLQDHVQFGLVGLATSVKLPPVKRNAMHAVGGHIPSHGKGLFVVVVLLFLVAAFSFAYG
jgi:hypothetical protein